MLILDTTGFNYGRISLTLWILTIGLGDYDYGFTDAKNEKHTFEIDYREEANPRPTSCDGMVFFRRLLVRTPTPDSFVEFYKLASEIDNTSDEKLRISVTNKYSEWNTYSRIPVRRLNTVYMDERVKQRIMDDVCRVVEQLRDMSTRVWTRMAYMAYCNTLLN
jgi:hypothetical protein